MNQYIVRDSTGWAAKQMSAIFQMQARNELVPPFIDCFVFISVRTGGANLDHPASLLIDQVTF